MDIYAALLEGAPPHVIQRTVEGQHQQMWKLREHHLVTTDSSDSDSGIELDLDTVNSLNPGDPLDAYFPAGTQIKEYRDGLTVQEPGCDRALRYQRISTIEAQKRDADAVDYVQDIIITGEVGIQKVFCQLQTLIYHCLRDIRPGVSLALLEGFGLVTDLSVFAKNMYVLLPS